MKKNKKGFSLIELLIVVAIILIIAAIAIPNLLKSRISANEASAVASIRSIATSEISYQMSNTTFTDLPGLNSAQLIDSLLGLGSKSGYSFQATGATDTFHAEAFPANTNTGVRSFCAIEDAVVRVSQTKIDTCTTSYSPLNN